MSKSKKEGVTVAEVWLPCSAGKLNKENAPSFVYEKGTSPYNNLQQLALAVSCHRPVLLQGPVGSGKSSTVEYLAYLTGHRSPIEECRSNFPLFLKVQLGEQTDARVLLGGYQCTEIPGQFIWKPGILTQAVLKGYWLLLEDIDCTSSDVVTVIDNLVKTQSLCVAGYSDNIIPHNDFQLFATQRTLRYESSSGVKINILKHWITIQLNPLSNSEVVQIINKKYPKLSSIASKMVGVLDLDFATSETNIRVPSARDVLKWCHRCHNYFETGSPESALRIFHDAVDIFCGFLEKELRFAVGAQIGFKLGIVKNKANFLNAFYRPNVSISTYKFVAGRCCLERREDSVVVMNRIKRNVFSLTTQSCCLIEKISCCLQYNEPVLLVGETGCGKTTVLQYIANILGRTLVVINMNQQSDTSDLVGGFKPVTFKWIMKPLCDKFETLFRSIFNTQKNADCLNKFSKLVVKQNWDVIIKFIIHVQKKALTHINFKLQNGGEGERMNVDGDDDDDDNDTTKWEKCLADWEELGASVEKYSKQLKGAEKSLVFSFIEGSLIKAMKEGHWVLLDEINLANSETLDCLSGLLEDSRGSILLLEKGESKPVYRDPGFRLFAAMNPATDVGKKQLPVGLRNRFTELYIDELEDTKDLLPLVEAYLTELNQNPAKLMKIVKFYLKVKADSKTVYLDGNGKKPHYSLRNLCRALMITAKNACGNVPRSLYEGLSISFLTQLDITSYKTVKDLIIQTVTESDVKALLNQPIPKPPEGKYVNLEGFWVPMGSLEPSTPDNYILTPTVQRHFRDLIRIVSLGSGIPVLLEGDTSVGKTSLINYLAKCSGNVCSRVNNHEHTDIQEYIGTYVADAQGKLVFKEGILCESMRKGHWLILDELNLAPTEVLEALNRVLDDNRELFIPETQKTIKAHDRFLLFATQNPPGLYGGRKELSRAFRNRFIELQFNQIPPEELVIILEKRCQIPLSYAKKMVSVMTDLQLRRRGSDIFVGKSGFITLRDLFRWGERYQKAKVESKFHDWEQHIADEGYILLAGRVRLLEESKVIEEVLCKYFKRKTNPENLFSLNENTSDVTKDILEKLIHHSVDDNDFKHIVWTYSMRRLAVLVSKALEFSEPVLIVGETGCGKTSVVQLLAKMKQQELFSVNCHMHSESADFLGGLRPVRNESKTSGKFFEWCDGPLVQAMTTGSFFLADEISLADDSVLERLNSLLEPERTILLAEKGGDLIENEDEEYVTVADKNFQFIGTMNPGGDYGKKELSPALRNRFTEIWAETSFNKFECYNEIIKHNLKGIGHGLESRAAEVMTRFLKWFQDTEPGKRVTISARDVMTWINFMNESDLDWHEACIHGVYLTFLDGLGSGSGFTGNVDFLKRFKRECFNYLTGELSQLVPNCEFGFDNFGEFYSDDEKVGIHPFYIKKGKWDTKKDSYVFNAPTTFANTKRLLRGLGTKKAILLEGSPGVGKTSLVTALAKAAGYKLARINFSDQTDVSDLFGADLPEEGGMAGHFVWRDGPFLTALKEGQWILLDELNLASQSVLEGLNAVLDHRGSVYIPELNKTFHISTETRLFGCQNPLKEGGNRRGLPKSFLNRFTQVFVETLTENDYVIILNQIFPVLSLLKIKKEFVINQMVKFTGKICEGIAGGQIGLVGGPWELNLRDITRWAEGVVDDMKLGKDCEREEEETRLSRALYKHMNVLYLQRFRTRPDRVRVYDIYVSFFGEAESVKRKPQLYVTKDVLIIGENATEVKDSYFYGDMNEFKMFADSDNAYKSVQNEAEKAEILKLCSSYRGKRKMEDLRVLEKQYPVLGSLSQCVNRNWLAILIGESGTGKTNCVRTLAALKGENLRIMSCNSAMDTTEILGGFEQTDYNRHFDGFTESARVIVLSAAKRYLKQGKEKITVGLLKRWLEFKNLPLSDDSLSATAAFDLFLARLEFLEKLLRSGDLKKDEDLSKRSKYLVQELHKLKRNLSTSDCLTFGGKFEWVDSILVKALKDGSWLLMEDVNLCSNAVLDRLNCLLEPNGVLTIGERGADADGKSITVTPNPNFRLFFTMDPRNGPISRAMRNRGVEIYLLRDEDIRNWPRLDLLSLLTDAGIPDVETQRALIELESNCDHQNISTLTSNGFWTAQYRRHGFGKAEAFEKASKHVYRTSGDETIRLIEELSNKLTEDKRFSMAFARPSLSNVIIDPRYARSKQCCALFHFLTDVIKNYSRGRERGNGNDVIPSEALEYFFGSEKPMERLSVADMAAFNVLHIYLTVSKECVDMLNVWLKKYDEEGNPMKSKELLVKLSRRLSDFVPESTPTNFPWDARWFEEIHQLIGSPSESESNKTLVLMKYLFYLSLEKVSNQSKNITVTKYSKSVMEGRLEDAFPNQPIVSKFLSYIKDFDDLTLETLNCGAVKVTEDDAKWFLDVMKWRFRLGHQGNLILVSDGSKKSWNEDVLTLLELHLSWFLDFVVWRNKRKSLLVFKTLPETLRQKYTQYFNTSEKIVSSQNSSKLIKMSNVFRNSLGHPSPTKYLAGNRLESETSAMEITQSDDFSGDPIILRDILNSFIGHLNLKTAPWWNDDVDVSTNQDLDRLPSLLSGLRNEVKHALPLKDLLQEYCSSNWREKQKMASELTFFSMKILNCDYEFAEEVNETSEHLYLNQVLPFHRSVWTSRVLQIVFNSDSLWNLSSYAKSQEELWTLLLTILPNTAKKASFMDRFSNDKSRLSLEINRILKSTKKCLGIESDERGLKEVLTEMSEKSHFGVEKIFYTRLNTIVSSFLGLNVSQDSGFDVLGCYWSLLGLLELLILREGKIDPIRKKLIKANYVMAEVTELETETTALELYSAITGISSDHFYWRDLKERLTGSRESLLKYSHLKNVERDPESFQELCKEMESFMTTFDEIYRFCGSVLEKGVRGGRDDQFGQHLYRKGRFIVLRNKKFAETLEKGYVTHFADLVYPMLSASSQIEHGMNLLMSELLRRPFSHSDEVNTFVSELGRCPITPKLDLLSKFQKVNVASWPKEALNKIESNKLLILFSSCVAKVNEWLLVKNDSNYDQVMGVFSLVVEFWKKEEERKEKEEMERESLFLKKGVEKCKTTPEEEEFLQDQMKLFPTFEEDFVESSSGEACDGPKADIGFLTFEHLCQVSKMHMEIVKQFVKTGWSPNRSVTLTPDFVSPIRMRFVLLSKIMPNISYLLDHDLDRTFFPGLLVLMNCKQSGSCSTDARLFTEKDAIYDFYRDKNVEEVSKCLEILKGLKKRLDELLNEWPEHPTLVQIKVIIERVLGFPVDSPVMRFLTGLEYLLQSCQHWESVAHSGVSIADHLINITNLIIEWRKLELQGWRHCLQAAHERLKNEAFKWWFHFWCLLEEYLMKNEESSLEDLLKALYNFIETSPVGEFETRLEILISYHYHLLHLPRSKKRDTLVISLWNLYSFYQQFKADVSKRLSDESAPIFIKLKEFVKIAKWHDITYWSVKQAIEKSHRTLLKFIKEYEVILKRKVELNQFDPTRKEEIKKKKKSPMNMNITQYLKDVKQGDVKMAATISGVKNLNRKLEKAVEYSNDVILRAEYPNLILNLERLSEEICETTQHFANLDVDRSLSQEKQKAQAKNIVHQKRRALADLFKTLSKIGLSYRAGLKERSFEILDLCDSPPADFSERASDPRSSGEAYYLKSIFRKLVLENSLLTPSKEIGPQVIERLRGFSGHFMEMNKKQKVSLVEGTVALVQLQKFEKALSSLTKPDNRGAIPNQERFSQKVDKLRKALGETCYVLRQFAHVLDSWPLTGSERMKKMNFLSGDLTPDLLTSSKSDQTYASARGKFDEILWGLSNLIRTFDESLAPEMDFDVRISKGSTEIRRDEFAFYSSANLKVYEKTVEEFKRLLSSLIEFKGLFSNDSVCCHLDGCLDYIEQLAHDCEDYVLRETISDVERTRLEKVLAEQVGTVIEDVLLAIQRLVKKYVENRSETKDNGIDNNEDEGEGGGEEEEDEGNELLDNHFDKKLVDCLHSDVKDLAMDRVNEGLASIFNYLSSFSESSDLISGGETCLRVLSAALPFVRQYSTLCSYFIDQLRFCYRTSNKLSSILFATFIQVTQKGYCIPPEYEEDGDGEGWSEKEGGGFTGGEGEGQKDVSDRIESEDQLEDARPQSEKDKEQENDCKEEEKGIEMSEDFDGKTQDLENKNDDDDDEDRDDEEEPDDKEMGETEAGADKLESQMWSDSENEEEDNTEKKEEEGKGEQINKDKYAAKDEDNEGKENQDEGIDKERKEKQKEINEMEEPEDNGDQVDPYHGKHEPELEPEPLDLPEDMQLDDAEMKDDENAQEENPFDIDAMKECQPPTEMEEDEGDKENKEKNEEEFGSDSDDEGKEAGDTKAEKMDVNEEEETEEDGEKKNEGEGETMEDEEEKKQEEDDLTKKDDFQPSDDRPSEMAAQPAPETKQDEMSSADQVVGGEEQKQNEFQAQEVPQNSEMEPKGVGSAEIEQTKQAHDANMSKKEKLKSGQSLKEREKKRERPGKSDEDRCLGNEESRVSKKLKTLEKTENNEEETKEEEKGVDNEESDLYQHVSEKVQEASQILDAATKEQAQSQSIPNKEEEENVEEPTNEDDIAMDVDEEEPEVDGVDKRKPSEVEKTKSFNKNTENEGDALGEEVKNQIEGDLVETMTVERGPETTFHTQLSSLNQERSLPLQPEEIKALRLEIQEQLSKFNQNKTSTGKSAEAWHLLTSVVDGLARDLSEQLRLILEPTRATRLKGDYRTGRRINMRRVINYIASEFRKDNIWLRRTKPWKREHEIILAIDDSSSMSHNESKELAFESLALVFKALGLIEAGHLGVLSFGEKTTIVHRPGDPFCDDTGARILEEFTFEQKKTLVCEMLDVSTSLMTQEKKKEEVARLLLIISDGRGVFSEGLDRVKTAVRRATDSGIFVVFVIIDDPRSKNSIMDIRMPEFKDGKFLGIKSYMELFPFPYYLILRDIVALPNTLSDALRQWFQLVVTQ